MPVLFACREQDDVTGPNLLDRPRAFRSTAPGPIFTQVGTHLGALYSSNYLGSQATWLDVDGTNPDPARRGQDLITQTTQVVPEPSTLMMMGLGWRLIRRRRAQA